jgi:hypothetical protein
MNNFEEWYKSTYPELYPELDDMYEQLKGAFYSGYNSGVSQTLKILGESQ